MVSKTNLLENTFCYTGWKITCSNRDLTFFYKSLFFEAFLFQVCIVFWTTVCIAFFCLSQTIFFRYATEPLGQYPHAFGIHLLLVCCCHPIHLTTSPYIQAYPRTLVWALVAPKSVFITVKFLAFLHEIAFP